MNMTKNAVLYLRVSTEEQVENFSLGTQEEICRREAAYKGYTVDKVFREEGKSAKTMKGRVALIQLLEYCRLNRKDIEAVMVYKTDRLSRQIFDYLLIQQKLSSLGIKLLSATEPTDDTAMGRFLGNFFAQIAQFDNDIRSERARNGMKARFRAGLFHNGHPPYGYISMNGVVIKNPEVFDKIRSAWDLMATGTKSIAEITKFLNHQGVNIRLNTTARMFRKKFYAGILYSPTYQEEVQGQHIPMITLAQFEKVQAILDERNPKKLSMGKRNHVNSDFPLRRFIKCQRCGVPFTGGWSQGRMKKYGYYFCRARCCRSQNVSIGIIHSMFFELLKGIRMSNVCEEIFLLLIEKEFQKRFNDLKKRGFRRDQQIRKLVELQKKLVQKHLLGVYSDEIYKEQNDMLVNSISNAKALTNNKFIEQYNSTLAGQSIMKKICDVSYVYENLECEYKIPFLSLIFPKGVEWIYPGLSIPKLNPLFQASCDKIQNSIKDTGKI